MNSTSARPPGPALQVIAWSRCFQLVAHRYYPRRNLRRVNRFGQQRANSFGNLAAEAAGGEDHPGTRQCHLFPDLASIAGSRPGTRPTPGPMARKPRRPGRASTMQDGLVADLARRSFSRAAGRPRRETARWRSSRDYPSSDRQIRAGRPGRDQGVVIELAAAKFPECQNRPSVALEAGGTPRHPEPLHLAVPLVARHLCDDRLGHVGQLVRDLPDRLPAQNVAFADPHPLLVAKVPEDRREVFGSFAQLGQLGLDGKLPGTGRSTTANRPNRRSSPGC